MANPVVVEVTRGALVESAHRGAGAVVDADGRVVMTLGDSERPVYPRSAIKALQALPLVESGAADRLGLSDKELGRARARDARQGGLRRRGARMRRALAARRGRSPRARAFGPDADRSAQQLLW